MQKVVAIVPTFNPQPSVLRNVADLRLQVDAVIVVDDGSDRHASETLNQIEAAGVTVYRSAVNGGIASALNMGLILARQLEHVDFILTVDQDTRVPPTYVAQALAESTRLERAGVIHAAVGAGLVNGNPLRPCGGGAPVHGLAPTREAMQSGLLIRSATLEKVGGFDAGLFIDCVDIEFVLRCAAHGLDTYLSRRCMVEHSLGAPMRIRFGLGRRRRTVELSYHGPARRYYITRNRIRIDLSYGGRFPRWLLRSVWQEFIGWALCMFFGAHRPLQLLGTLLGVIDGLRGRTGALPLLLQRILDANGRGPESVE